MVNMNNLFNQSLDVTMSIQNLKLGCEHMSAKVNAVISTRKQAEEEGMNVNELNKFMMDEYYKLAEELVKLGIITKEW